MKKAIALILSLVLLIGGLVGCSEKSEQAKSGTIYATIAPVYDFTRKIAGNRQQVELMVTSDVHDYEPSAAEVAKFQSAPIIVKNGMGIDSFVDKIDTSGARIVDTSVGVAGEAYDGHSADDGHGHEEMEYDPHIWLYPGNAKIQMENIKNALCEYDPDNKDYYEGNYSEMAKKCDELDAKLRGLSGKKIVTTHSAYTYLENIYGIVATAMDMGSSGEVSPARMKEIVEYCKANDITNIYTEAGASDKNANSAAKEIGGETITINSFESIVDGKDDYFNIMEENYIALSKEG